MPSVFDVLGHDHDEVKQMLAELEAGPTAATGASGSDLARRKELVEQLVIEEPKHEAVEEMYFWPAVRDTIPDGGRFADTAIEQEQEGKEVLDKLDKLDASEPEFEQPGRYDHPGRLRAHQLRGDAGLAPAAPRSAPRKPAIWETRSSRAKTARPARTRIRRTRSPEDGRASRRRGRAGRAGMRW
jgi:hypothetical protein